jgi:signal transduction histidine kinase
MRIVTWGGTDAAVGPFAWHTVEIDGRPELVAMRTVRTSDRSVVQGMLVDRAAVRDALEAETLPVRLRPHEEPDDRTVVEPLALAGVKWEVAVDAGPAVADARHRAQKLRARFRRLFWGGTGSAALAALLVVGLVGQAERLARQRSRFAASAAHELRTPLAGMRVYGDMLAEGLGDPAAGAEYARQIAAEADRLGRVVSNVLGYTRLERGGPLVRPEPADPAPVVREAAERMRPALAASGARLELDVPGHLPAVPLDRDAVFQIVQNLVDNAERYSRDADDRTVHVRLRPAAGGIELAVADRGPGIPPRDRRRLFRPFTRAAEPDAPAGLGLGLALVAALAAGHDGAVRYEPREGGGSVLTVILPGSGA